MDESRKRRPQCRVVRGVRTFPDGAIYVRPKKRRFETAARWAARRTHAELVRAVALLFQRRAEDAVELYARYIADIDAHDRVMKKVAAERAGLKLTRNPKAAAIQAAKAEAREFWRERREGRHPRLSTELKFAMEVCKRWPVLTSADKVRQWARDWGKEADAEPKVREAWNAAKASRDDFSRFPEIVALAVVRHWPEVDFSVALEVAKRLQQEH